MKSYGCTTKFPKANIIFKFIQILKLNKMKMEYEKILEEMHVELNSFSSKSDQLSGYQYEKQFRDLTDKYNRLLFQSSLGKVPKSKNEKQTLQTSFGEVVVKKKGIR